MALFFFGFCFFFHNNHIFSLFNQLVEICLFAVAPHSNNQPYTTIDNAPTPVNSFLSNLPRLIRQYILISNIHVRNTHTPKKESERKWRATTQLRIQRNSKRRMNEYKNTHTLYGLSSYVEYNVKVAVRCVLCVYVCLYWSQANQNDQFIECMECEMWVRGITPMANDQRSKSNKKNATKNNNNRMDVIWCPSIRCAHLFWFLTMNF